MAGEADRVIADLVSEINRKKRGAAARALQTVVLATPVGNPTLWQNPEAAPPGYVGGAARANWQVSIGSAITTPIEDIDASGGATIAKGTATAQGANLGETIFLVNNLPYIGRLNDGHSTQAPVGFIEAAIQRAITEVSGA